MPLLAGALREAGSGKCLVFCRRFGGQAKAELAAEVLIVGRHCQRQPHVLGKKLLHMHGTS